MNVNVNQLPHTVVEDGPVASSRRALAMLASHGIDPTPPAYEIAYLFYSGTGGNAVDEPLGDLIESGSGISEYDLVQIHDGLHNSSSDFLGDLKQELAKAVSFIDRHAASNDRYARRIECRTEAASNVISVDQLNRLVGELIHENKKMQHETELLRCELNRSSSTIENLEKALDESRRKEMIDALTELGNRRFFNAWLERERKEAVSTGKPMCLAIADLDQFKRVNDSYGHQIGDAVLCLFARIIRANVKGRDHVARYGGEEFAIILPQTRLRSAIQLMDKIRRELSARNIVIVEDKIDIGKVTASFGVAELCEAQSNEELVQVADSKLYEAKRSGRNLVKF